jgi:hypothetical protein
MAIASKETGAQLWRTVQHEGFHQFAASVMTPRLPVWANEGLAEYFGEGIWTGDGLVCGVIPPGRLKRVRQLISQDKILPFADMVGMSHAKWNSPLDIRNYDQAWSMVQFLAHADEGKYQGPFGGYINELARGTEGQAAFAKHFGRDIDAFQKRYTQWFSALDDNPTQDLYLHANVETLTAFLARATALRQKFETADEFFQAAKDGKLDVDPRKNGRLWLPPHLLAENVALAAKHKTWSLLNEPRKLPRLRLALGDGTVFVGSFEIEGENVGHAKVEVARPKPATAASAGPASAPASKASG